MKTLTIVFFIFIFLYFGTIFGFILLSYFNKPAEFTSGIHSIQSHLEILESKWKNDKRIISRDQWADKNLEVNTTDLKPLSLPVIGVIAHHTSVDEDKCFTIGERQHHLA